MFVCCTCKPMMVVVLIRCCHSTWHCSLACLGKQRVMIGSIGVVTVQHEWACKCGEQSLDQQAGAVSLIAVFHHQVLYYSIPVINTYIEFVKHNSVIFCITDRI